MAALATAAAQTAAPSARAPGTPSAAPAPHRPPARPQTAAGGPAQSPAPATCEHARPHAARRRRAGAHRAAHAQQRKALQCLGARLRIVVGHARAQHCAQQRLPSCHVRRGRCGGARATHHLASDASRAQQALVLFATETTSASAKPVPVPSTAASAADALPAPPRQPVRPQAGRTDPKSAP